MHTELESQIKKVLVIGLGQLGLPVAKYVKDRGYETFGYDINQPKSRRCRKKLRNKKYKTV